MREEKRLVDVPISEQISGTYYFVVNDNGTTMQVPKAEMTRYFDKGISDWSQLTNKPFEDVDSTAFDVTGGILKMKKYHSHENLDVLNKFSMNNENKLLFNGEVVKSDIPEASNTVAGIVYIDDTIDANNTNNHATTTKAVSDYVSNQRTEIENNIPQADNDTIKNNNGILSADVIGNWYSGTHYPVGYFAVYNDCLYECKTDNSDTVWDETKWTLIGSSGGTTIDDWIVGAEYNEGDLVINNNKIYRCTASHISTGGTNLYEVGLTEYYDMSLYAGNKVSNKYSETPYLVVENGNLDLDNALKLTGMYNGSHAYSSVETPISEQTNFIVYGMMKVNSLNSKNYLMGISSSATNAVASYALSANSSKGKIVHSVFNGLGYVDYLDTIDPLNYFAYCLAFYKSVDKYYMSSYLYDGNNYTYIMDNYQLINVPTTYRLGDLNQRDSYGGGDADTSHKFFACGATSHTKEQIDSNLKNIYDTFIGTSSANDGFSETEAQYWVSLSGTTIDDTNTTSTEVTWSANKINSVINDIYAILGGLTSTSG